MVKVFVFDGSDSSVDSVRSLETRIQDRLDIVSNDGRVAIKIISVTVGDGKVIMLCEVQGRSLD